MKKLLILFLLPIILFAQAGGIKVDRTTSPTTWEIPGAITSTGTVKGDSLASVGGGTFDGNVNIYLTVNDVTISDGGTGYDAGTLVFAGGGGTGAIADNNLSVEGTLTVVGTTVNMVTSGTTLTVGVGADNGTVSAGVFTDRTPIYEGDALTEIKKIKGIDGKIDHESLPEFVKAHKTKDITEKKPKKDKDGIDELDDDGNAIMEDVKIGEEAYIERNIGNMISMNVKAVQQLIDKIEYLETELAKKKDK